MKKNTESEALQIAPYDEALSLIEDARRTKATRLNLSRLGITSLPESVGQLYHLEYLDLSFN